MALSNKLPCFNEGFSFYSVWKKMLCNMKHFKVMTKSFLTLS